MFDLLLTFSITGEMVNFCLNLVSNHQIPNFTLPKILTCILQFCWYLFKYAIMICKWYKPLKQEIEFITFYSVTILTFCAFTYVTQFLCPKRRDIPPLVRALHDKGVISDILSIPGKPFATWEILIGHRWLVQPPPTAWLYLPPMYHPSARNPA